MTLYSMPYPFRGWPKWAIPKYSHKPQSRDIGGYYILFYFCVQETLLEISLDTYFLFNNLEPGQRSCPHDTYDIKVAL